ISSDTRIHSDLVELHFQTQHRRPAIHSVNGAHSPNAGECRRKPREGPLARRSRGAAVIISASPECHPLTASFHSQSLFANTKFLQPARPAHSIRATR